MEVSRLSNEQLEEVARQLEIVKKEQEERTNRFVNTPVVPESVAADEKIEAIENVVGLESVIEEAVKDDSPFLVQDGEELHVIGDATKTEFKLDDYEVELHVPTALLKVGEKEIAEDAGRGYSTYSIVKKDVGVSPRLVPVLAKALFDVFPALDAIKDVAGIDAEGLKELVKNMGDAERREFTMGKMSSIVNMYAMASSVMQEGMYEGVGKLLGVPDDRIDFMIPSSVFNEFMRFCDNNPSVVNYAETFFGLPKQGDLIESEKWEARTQD
ncbi:MAG: hypothetical protein FWE25_03280 [Lachnospiraceae bacterium]|nr:hypothetical protein [Lachnospiraceae bacterium]